MLRRWGKQYRLIREAFGRGISFSEQPDNGLVLFFLSFFGLRRSCIHDRGDGKETLPRVRGIFHSMKLFSFLVCQWNHLFLDGFYWFIMSKVVQKKNHWTTKVNECTVSKDARGELNVQLLGGAENGEFAYIGHVNGNAVQYRNGKVSEGELVLEVETLSVSGLPLYDVLTVIKNCKGPIRLKTVRQGKCFDLTFFPLHVMYFL